MSFVKPELGSSEPNKYPNGCTMQVGSGVVDHRAEQHTSYIYFGVP